MKDKAYLPDSVNQNPLPENVIANETVATSFNSSTRQILGNYSFGILGGIQVGQYSAGVSGEIRISPSGILGRNSSNTTTFQIDATTGDATFEGTVYARAGEIGGFTIELTYLYAGTGANTAGISPADYPFWAGATYANRATAPFNVTPAGAITATSGTIGGWTLSATTLEGGDAILDSNGTITVSDGNDKVIMTTATGVGYLDFYASGSLKARIRGTTSGSGGALLTQGDLVVSNNYSFLATGTTATDFARFGVTSSNQTWIVTSDDDVLYVLDGEEKQMLALSANQAYFGSGDYALSLQLKEKSEPANPSTGNTALIYLDSGDNNLYVKFDSGAKVLLATHP